MTAITFEPASTTAPPQNVAAKRDYISFSAILYQQCPLRFFFRYIAGLPEETVGASLLFGSAIHRAMESHFRRLLEGGAPPSQSELLAEYRLGWKDRSQLVRFGKDEDANTLDALAGRMLQSFATSDLARPGGTILAVEETLRGNLIPGLPDVLGRVDLIMETPEELVISDWKSS